MPRKIGAYDKIRIPGKKGKITILVIIGVLWIFGKILMGLGY